MDVKWKNAKTSNQSDNVVYGMFYFGIENPVLIEYIELLVGDEISFQYTKYSNSQIKVNKET